MIETLNKVLFRSADFFRGFTPSHRVARPYIGTEPSPDVGIEPSLDPISNSQRLPTSARQVQVWQIRGVEPRLEFHPKRTARQA